MRPGLRRGLMSTGAQVLIAVPLLLAIALLLFWSSRRADAQRRDRFIDRPPISNEEFLAECSINQTDQALVALALRQQIATSLAIPAEKISPNDRFDRELRPVKGWEHDDGLWILSKELADNTCTIKNLRASTQETISQQSLAGYPFK